MKAYKRSDFIKLPAMTIYSRIYPGELMSGLFCKTSGKEFEVDWVEQDLIGEPGFPGDIADGVVAIEYQLNLRDTFQDFETDLECGGRDGMFDDEDVFVVWGRKDVIKLRNYLNDCINYKPC